jgi:hypothetical protein
MDLFTVLYSIYPGVSGNTYGTESRNYAKDGTEVTLLYFWPNEWINKYHATFKVYTNAVLNFH